MIALNRRVWRSQNNFETLKVTALDLSLFNLRMAKQNLNGIEGVTYVESNAEHMAIENESQDVVTCNFVLSTIPKEAQVIDKNNGRWLLWVSTAVGEFSFLFLPSVVNCGQIYI